MSSFEVAVKVLRSKIRLNHYRLTFLGVLGIGNLPLLYFCLRPISGPHSFRQAQTAFPLQYWDRHGFNLVPSLPIKGIEHQTWILELPAFQWIAFSLHSLTPFTIEICVRSFALILMVSSFYLILRHIFGLQGIPLIIGVLVAEYTPFTMLWGTTGLIDWLALFCSIKGYLLIFQAADLENPRKIIAGTIIVFVAYLIKAPIAFFATMFMLAHPYPRFGKNFKVALTTLKYYLLATLIGISGVRIWANWQSTLYPSSDPRSVWVPNDSTRSWYFGNISQYTNILQNASDIFERLFKTLYGPLPTLILILATFLVFKFSRKSIIPILACVIYVSVFINLNLVHDYYQIPVAVSILSLVIAMVIKVASYSPGKSFSLVFISTALVVTGFGSTAAYFDSQYYVHSLFTRSAKIDGCPAPKQVEEPVLLLGGENNPEYLYGCRLEGFMLEDRPIDHEVFSKEKESYRFMYLRTNQPTEDIDEYLGRYPVKVFKIGENWYEMLWETEDKVPLDSNSQN